MIMHFGCFALHTDLILAMVLMIHLSVELERAKVEKMDSSLKTSILGIALVQVNFAHIFGCCTSGLFPLSLTIQHGKGKRSACHGDTYNYTLSFLV